MALISDTQFYLEYLSKGIWKWVDFDGILFGDIIHVHPAKGQPGRVKEPCSGPFGGRF